MKLILKNIEIKSKIDVDGVKEFSTDIEKILPKSMLKKTFDIDTRGLVNMVVEFAKIMNEYVPYKRLL